MNEGTIAKALEVWGLQVMLDVSILLGLLALGLAIVQGYYRSLEKRLTLRVSIEIWQVATIVFVDACLVAAVIIGYLVMNPDIMSDIKMPVPFYPAATVFLAAALVVRLFHGGHEAGSKSYDWSIFLMVIANIVNIFGFTFVIEGSSPEYLELHPSPLAEFLKATFRSNKNPGLEVAQLTFYVCFPLLMAVLAWGLVAALSHIRRAREK